MDTQVADEVVGTPEVKVKGDALGFGSAKKRTRVMTGEDRYKPPGIKLISKSIYPRHHFNDLMAEAQSARISSYFYLIDGVVYVDMQPALTIALGFASTEEAIDALAPILVEVRAAVPTSPGGKLVSAALLDDLVKRFADLPTRVDYFERLRAHAAVVREGVGIPSHGGAAIRPVRSRAEALSGRLADASAVFAELSDDMADMADELASVEECNRLRTWQEDVIRAARLWQQRGWPMAEIMTRLGEVAALPLAEEDEAE